MKTICKQVHGNESLNILISRHLTLGVLHLTIIETVEP